MYRSSVVSLALTAAGTLSACGEAPSPRPSGNDLAANLPEHVCELVDAGEMSAIFAGVLIEDRSAPSNRVCTWQKDGRLLVQYQIRTSSDDLQTQVARLEEQLDEGLQAEPVVGIGDSAVWTTFGLLTRRNGLTVQVIPYDDDLRREPLIALANLLLERLTER
jgi:hypothetical protein